MKGGGRHNFPTQLSSIKLRREGKSLPWSRIRIFVKIERRDSFLKGFIAEGIHSIGIHF